MKWSKFVVVIPTRERGDTLEATLKTCVRQDYEQLEILVSDNFSQDRTREVVESFKDSRIRYINTGHRVSMSSNWEFALSHVTDGYVTIIGDDDGLLPTAIVRLNDLLHNLGQPEALTWKIASYGWPSHIIDSDRHRLLVPLGQALKKWDARHMLREVSRFRALYFLLPSLYNSFVQVEAIQKVKRLSGGQFFQSITPDMYSGIALACVIDSYYFSFRPYTVSGVSHHSNGASQLGETNHTEAMQRYLAENELTFHPQLVPAPAVEILTAEAFLQAQKHLRVAREFPIDLQETLRYALKVAAIQNPERYHMVVEAIRQIGRINHLESYAETIIATTPNRPKDNRAIVGYNFAFNTLRLPTDDLDIRDIYDACALCEHLLTLNDHGYHRWPNIIRTTLQLALKFFTGGGSHFVRSQKLNTLR